MASTASPFKKHFEVHILLNTTLHARFTPFTAHFSWLPAPIDLALMLRSFRLNDTAAINHMRVHLHIFTIKALLMGFSDI